MDKIMKISDILTPEDETKLTAQMNREFSSADTHTKTWRNAMETVAEEYLFPVPGQDKVNVRKVWNNLKLRKSVFLSDTIQVTNVPMSGVLGAETAKNCNKVFKANFKSMNIRQKYEEVLDDDGLFGVAALAVDGWNNHSQEPILSYVDSRAVYADPKNWRGNKMRYCSTMLRKNFYTLEADASYDQSRIALTKLQRLTELQELDRANNGKRFTETDVGEGLVDVLNHVTLFKSSRDKEVHKYLVTWGADKTTIIRAVKMMDLTDEERADPSKISLGIQLFRSNPIKGQFAGASLIDEIGQYQDIETLLYNLQVEQAIEAAVGGPTFVDGRLGVDIDDLSSMNASGAYVPTSSTDPNITAGNGITMSPTRPQNPIVGNTINALNQLSQEATNISQLAQGQSLSGTQTKSEVQTIQQNINQVLSYMASNLMESLQGMWEDIYRSYAANMSSQRRKQIVVVDAANNPDSYGFRKGEFISDGEVYIVIKSKAQEDLKKQKNFATRLSIHQAIAGSVVPGSAQGKIWDRGLIKAADVSDLDPLEVIPYGPDERKAYANLDLLNINRPLKSKPQAGEDHNIFITIYKTGLQTDARDEAIQLREQILAAEPKQPPAPEGGGVGGGGAGLEGLGASMIASDNAQGQDASLGDVSA